MVTSDYKWKSSQYCDFELFLFLHTIPARVLSSSPSLPEMSQAAQGQGGQQNGHSDKMVCRECFLAKCDGELKLPCQNPKCHFYCSSASLSSLPGDDVFSSEIAPPPFAPSFNKEVGHDRKGKFCYGSSEYLGTCQALSKDKMWRKEPLVPGFLNSMAVQKVRSKSLSTAPTSGGSMNIQRLLGGQDPLIPNKDLKTANLYRSRMMSLPECPADPLCKGGRDLVEDSFVSSTLLLDYERGYERPHFGPKGNFEDGHFGRSTGLVDFMGYSACESRCTPIISALPTTTSSTSSNTFDMTQLKMEMSKVVSSQVDPSLAVSSRPISPESMDPTKSSSVRDISTLLGFGLGGISHSSETYSRKVFVGGLPQEVDEDDIKIFFMHFGALTVDWPHKNHSRACIPPKGYAFLLFKFESSVHKLLLSCKPEGEKHFIYMPTPTPTFAKKKVQVRPWFIADSYHCVDPTKPVDPRKAVFVGGVPRPLKASELSEVMTQKYGNVALIMIDADSDLKYPKGAACVVFSSHASYIAAVSARFMQLSYGALDKKVEIKPYVLDGQMCDECTGVQCGGKPAPFFCGSVACLQYYCEYCWATVHSMPGRQNHRPLLKDIGDKARFY